MFKEVSQISQKENHEDEMLDFYELINKNINSENKLEGDNDKFQT